MKILRIETCPDCKYGCHTQSGSYWWCTHPEIGDHHFDVNKGVPDWCPLPDEAVEEMLEIMEKARRWNEWQQYPNLVALINTFWKILNENEEYKSEALLRDALGVIIANDYDYKNKFVSVELVDKILALIESQRCEWTLGKFGWEFSCGGKTHYSKTQFEKFCHNCGKRIEVKDAKR
jgi:hypothetical protein